MSFRAFIPATPQPALASQITLNADESHYLVRVRRAKVGTECELLDRKGKCYLAKLTSADPKSCVLRIDAIAESLPPRAPLELWLGMPDAPALLAALARATELGASCVRLIQCRFAQGRRPSAPRIARCLDAAMRQSGRRDAPQVLGPQPLDQALADDWQGSSWLACPASTPKHSTPSSEAQRIAIGPEGGYCPQEQAQLRAAGFEPLRLGPFVLRTEVAVTAALAKLQSPSPSAEPLIRTSWT